MTVNVIHDFDGLKGELVEKIERKGRQVKTEYGSPITGKYRIYYKGKTYISFILPDNYGDIAGMCIKVERGL